MGNIFVKKPKITEVDKAILSLKTQRRKLAQYQQQCCECRFPRRQWREARRGEPMSPSAFVAMPPSKEPCRLLPPLAVQNTDAERFLINVTACIAKRAPLTLISSKFIFSSFTRVPCTEKQAAKDLLREKKKDRALLGLKRKKVQEELLKQVDVWLINVEQQVQGVVLNLSHLHLLPNLVHNFCMISLLLEINAILGEKLPAEDEEEVLAEFENLESQLQDLPEVPSAAPSVENVEEELDLPDVPTKPPVIADAVNEDAQETSAGITERKKVMEEPLPA
ncbi:putative la-related protein 6-like [Capsicum annuum]|nr:putative la-related protein 6-like [Capsicum annuum]